MPTALPVAEPISLSILPIVHATTIDPLAVSGQTGSGEMEKITPELVCRMFPATPGAHIAANLAAVLRALGDAGLTDTTMILAALATIRAEAECFEPVAEGVSVYNTSPGGRPFDLYDHRAELGTQGAPDGERFRGRGFVQLTGRANYARYAGVTGLDLLERPELACEVFPAATLLARFLLDHASAIRRALGAGDLAGARRLVNGGVHGLGRFSDAFRRGSEMLG